MKAYVLSHVRTGEELEVVKHLRRMPGVVRADFTFGPYDVICEIEAPDLSGIGKIVSGTIRVTPGVTDTLTCLAVE
jgi:DNA-binding Lrp family transcriptional regulator